MRDFTESDSIEVHKRKAFVRDWIARNQRRLAGGLASGMLVLPLMAQAQTEGFVNVNEIRGIQSVQQMPDGALRLILNNGQQVIIQDGDVIVTADGAILISQAAADMVATLVGVDAAAIGGAEVIAAGAAAGLLAAAAGSGSAAEPEPPVPTLNQAQVQSQAFEQVFGAPPPAGATRVFVTLGEGDDAVEVEAAQDGDGNWTFSFDPAALGNLQGEQVLSFRAEREVLDEDDEPTGEFDQIGSGSANVIIDTIPPKLEITSAAGDDGVLSSVEQETGLIVTGTTDAEDGQEVTVVIEDPFGSVVVSGTAIVSGPTWTATIDAEDLLDDTEYTVFAAVEDAAGNKVDMPAEFTFTTDFTAEIGINDFGPLDTAASFFDLDVTGTTGGVQEGQPVTFTFGGVSYPGITVDADGTWSVTIPQEDLAALRDAGVAEITATASVSDLAGNTGTATETAAATFEPPVLTITEPAADVVLNGLAAPDGLTVAGETVPGAEVTVSINGDDFAPVTADSDGAWTLPIAGDDLPADDTYIITASAELNGIQVADPATVGLTIDTVAPEVIITDLGFAGDTLNEAERADGFTITGTVSDAGTPDLADIVIALTVNGAPVPVTITTDGTDTATWTAEVPEGVRNSFISGEEVAVSVTATDPAENTSDPVAESFDTDFIAEIFFDDDLAITTINQFTGFQVTGGTEGVEEGQTVRVFLDAGGPFLGQVEAGGSWSALIPADVIVNLDDERDFSLSATVTDTAGNTGTADPVTVTTDFSLPALAITSPATGDFINAAFFDDEEDLVVEGVALPGEEVRVTIGSITLTVPEVGGDGIWSVTFDSDDVPTAQGDFDITAESMIDGTPVSITVTLTVDTEAPDAPVISFNDTGEVQGLTSDGEITVAGLEPGGRAEYSLDDGDTWVPFTGDSFTLEGDGPYTVIVRQFDAADNESDPSSELQFELLTATPPTPTVALADDTGTEAGLTSNGEVTVDLLVGDTIREFSIDGGDSWEPFSGDTIPFDVDGEYAVIVRQIDGAGNVSDPSDPLEFTLKTGIAQPEVFLAEDTGSVPGETRNGEFNVEGLEPGSIREYSLDGGDTWLPFSGTIFTLTEEGDYSVTVRQTDGAGNVSDPSDPLVFTLDTTPPEVSITSLAGIEDGGALTAAELYDSDGELLTSVAISGTAVGAPDGTVVGAVFMGNIAIGTQPVASVTDEAWSTTIPVLALLSEFGTDGPGQVEVRIADGAGNVGAGTLDFTMDVVIPTISVEQPADGFVVGLDAFENGITISGTTTDVPEGAEVTITIMDGPDDTEGFEGTAEVGADGSWSIFIEPQGVQGAADETAFTLTASVSDGIFPVAVSDSIGISTDIPPQVTINVGEDGALIISDIAENGFTISGTTRGVQEGQRVILQIDEGDGEGPTDIFEDDDDNPAVDEDGNWSVFIPNPNLDGVEPGMEFIFSANVANASGREADTASVTVVAYEPAQFYISGGTLVTGGAAAGALEFAIKIDPRFEFDPADLGPDGFVFAFAESVSFDPDVASWAPVPAPQYQTGLLPNTDTSEAADGKVLLSTVGFLSPNDPETGDPIDLYDVPLVRFRLNHDDESEAIILFVESVGRGSYEFVYGTDGADTLIAANTDSFIRGRGGDDQIDVSAPGVNTIIFEPTLALNGEDEITGFTIGGALADRIGIAFNDDFTQSDLRGTGEFFQIVEAGESIGANVGFVVFSTNFTDATPALEELAISGLGLGANERVFVLAGEEEGSSLALLFTDGDGNAEFEDLAVFEDLSFAELAGFSSANILGFQEFLNLPPA